jgi:PAS domain S-box-containing protein
LYTDTQAILNAAYIKTVRMDPVLKIIQETLLTEEERNRLFKLQFIYLPEFANFILKNKLKDLAISQLLLAKKLKIPILRYFDSFSDETLIESGMHSSKKLLNHLRSNQSGKYILESITDWVSDQVPTITSDQVVPEDITLISYSRRTAFRGFIPLYTHDLQVALKVAEEMDLFTVELDTLCFKILVYLQQRLYKQAQSIAKLGNWEWDLKKDKLNWSEEMFRIYEMESKATSLDNMASHNHPEDAAMIMEQMKISRENSSPHDFYYRICLKNGKQKYLHAIGEVITNQAGEAIKMFGTLQDSTKQKAVETELQEKQYFISKIAELTPSILAAYNIHTGKYQFVNRALQTLLGYDPSEAMERGAAFFIDIIHPEDLPNLIEKNKLDLLTANSGNRSNGAEIITEYIYRMRHYNGEYRWFHTYGTIFSRNKANEVEEVLNISVDVTERVAATTLISLKNEELTKSEERYHRMVEEVKDYAILLLNTDGIIENWNQGAEKLKGYKPEEIIGKHFRIFYTPENQKEKLPERLILQAINAGKAAHEGWRVRKDGSRFWGNIVITALHNQMGEVIGFSKVTRDLTERKNAEVQLELNAIRLEEKNERLEQMNKELESFNYIASHDLKEPLRKIKLFTDRIFQKNEFMSDDTKGYFAKILSATVRMEQLIQSILEYSLTSMQERKLTDTDLNVLLEEVKLDLLEAINEKNAQIESGLLPTLQVESGQFRQLFTNLISNSLKYSRKGVRPTIKITYELLSRNEGARPGVPGLYHTLIFTDNGIGFKQEYAGRIFDLFQRLHTRSEFDGTGIGLSICRKIMQNHEGFMEATGWPDEGAEFRLYLPVK